MSVDAEMPSIFINMNRQGASNSFLQFANIYIYNIQCTMYTCMNTFSECSSQYQEVGKWNNKNVLR